MAVTAIRGVPGAEFDMSSMMKRRKDTAESDSIRKKFEQGLRLQAQDRHDEAVSRFRKVVFAEPDNMGALKGLAQSLIATERQAEAIQLLDKRAETVAEAHAALTGLIGVCLAIEYFDLAEPLLKRLLEVEPDDPLALLNLANIHERRDEPQQAVDLISRIIEKDPTGDRAGDAYGALARVLASQAMFDDAIAAYRRAIELKPESSTVYTNLSSLFLNMGRNEEALKVCEQALNIDPECDGTRWNLSRALLAAGHIEEGWDLYGFGFACGQRKPLRPFPGLIWDGEPLKDKTIMVWREQGLGDDLYFATCYSDLIAQAGHVIIETNPRLIGLYSRTWPQATVRADTPASTGLGNYGKVDFDYTAPAGLVVSKLRRRISDFPAENTKLVPDPARVAQCRAWLDTLGPGPKIGLAWSSGVSSKLRALLYTELKHWVDLFAIEGASVINLQYAHFEEPAAELRREYGLTLHSMPGLDLFSDIEGAAALTSCLDAAVSPGTFPAVLAASLGIPVFYYSPKAGWPRLGTDRLPWFPTIRCHTLDYRTDRHALAREVTGNLRAFLGR
ncbi:MAG: tetratricopeptide repeat protein [Parvibaculum sp.]|nr:tetratricopeptide repeat protein [Parvibaculum sp.]